MIEIRQMSLTSARTETVCTSVCRVISEDEFEENRKAGASDDELFEPYSDKRWVQLCFSRS